jgi:hypothetical protein
MTKCHFLTMPDVRGEGISTVGCYEASSCLVMVTFYLYPHMAFFGDLHYLLRALSPSAATLGG